MDTKIEYVTGEERRDKVGGDTDTKRRRKRNEIACSTLYDTLIV